MAANPSERRANPGSGYIFPVISLSVSDARQKIPFAQKGVLACNDDRRTVRISHHNDPEPIFGFVGSPASEPGFLLPCFLSFPIKRPGTVPEQSETILILMLPLSFVGQMVDFLAVAREMSPTEVNGPLTSTRDGDEPIRF
jgi:hypothetical protein